VKRRTFITLLGGAAASWPLAARAQQPAMPVVGYLYAGSADANPLREVAFRKGLAETGYIEGHNVAIEYRFGDSRDERLPALVADLVRRRVNVIVLAGGSVGVALATKAATTTIPIVFGMGGDPIKLGLVASLNRPGGNLTGVSYFAQELGAKRLGLLHELRSGAGRLAALVNPANPAAESNIKEMQAAASALGQQIELAYASNNSEIDTAFSALVEKGFQSLVIIPHALFSSWRVQLATLAARHAIATMYSSREVVEVGGLMSYGTNLLEVHRNIGVYTGKILKGAKPADLLVMQPTKFELVINLQTAKVIGLPVPPTLLARADEVIE
jgi:putative tryptophan/tyrosine transport system substrate-binding protein